MEPTRPLEEPMLYVRLSSTITINSDQRWCKYFVVNERVVGKEGTGLVCLRSTVRAEDVYTVKESILIKCTK